MASSCSGRRVPGFAGAKSGCWPWCVTLGSCVGTLCSHITLLWLRCSLDCLAVPTPAIFPPSSDKTELLGHACPRSAPSCPVLPRPPCPPPSCPVLPVLPHPAPSSPSSPVLPILPVLPVLPILPVLPRPAWVAFLSPTAASLPSAFMPAQGRAGSWLRVSWNGLGILGHCDGRAQAQYFLCPLGRVLRWHLQAPGSAAPGISVMGRSFLVCYSFADFHLL